MQEAVNNCELVSALADGQLRGEEFTRTVEWVGADDDARLKWDVYHLVGDVLRSGEELDIARDTAFAHRVKLALRQEARFLPGTGAAVSVAENSIRPLPGGRSALSEAANAGVFHWKRLAGIAALAVVSVIGWQTWSEGGDQRGAPQLAQVPTQAAKPEAAMAQAVSLAQPPLMIRDPQLDALLAAHKQFGGTSALQVPTGFLRNATFEGAGR